MTTALLIFTGVLAAFFIAALLDYHPICKRWDER